MDGPHPTSLRGRLHALLGAPQSLLRRFQISLAALAVSLVVGMACVVSLLGLIPSSDYEVIQDVQRGYDNYSRRVTSFLGTTTAQTINLSRITASSIEKELAREGRAFSDVADNARLIDVLENSLFEDLSRASLIAPCSGAFAILDTTVNTHLPSSATSRAGVYVKIGNMSSVSPVSPDLVWLRGSSQVGLDNKIFFHNKWELEFDTERFPVYRQLKEAAKGDVSKSFVLMPSFSLPGTWEKMFFVCAPVVGSDGTFYGICGLELSQLFFKLALPCGLMHFPKVTGLVCQADAPNTLLPDTGLSSASFSGWFDPVPSSPLAVASDGSLQTFTGQERSYVGISKTLRLSPLDDKPWSISLLVPAQDYGSMAHIGILRTAGLAVLALLLAAVLISLVQALFFRPIRKGLEAVREGSAERTDIPEIDDLLEFLARQDEDRQAQSVEQAREAQAKDAFSTDAACGRAVQSPGTPPRPCADLSGYEAFVSAISTLTRAERAVFDLYMEGLSAAEVADRLFISMHTVKTHNKHIYVKLNVSSRKELMVYVQMMNGPLGSSPPQAHPAPRTQAKKS